MCVMCVCVRVWGDACVRACVRSCVLACMCDVDVRFCDGFGVCAGVCA